ncbi:MAG TPA: DUF4294 domain-containing protein [Flavobacteriales bacterium]|nr:DUF4294 domain-containing protein [Flavobacteriales bacterium]
MVSRLVIILLLSMQFLLHTEDVHAQGVGSKGIVMMAEVIDGDTFPMRYLPYVTIVESKPFKSDFERRKWERLKRNVKKVYPYAKLAGQLLDKYQVQLDSVETKRERKKYFRLIEKELKAEFDDDIRNMTTTQGRILVKLIDRETGNSSFEIVQEFRGNFTAFFWQGFSKMFGQDLKSRYDPLGEDAEIENIIYLIEAGAI